MRSDELRAQPYRFIERRECIGELHSHGVNPAEHHLHGSGRGLRRCDSRLGRDERLVQFALAQEHLGLRRHRIVVLRIFLQRFVDQLVSVILASFRDRNSCEPDRRHRRGFAGALGDGLHQRPGFRSVFLPPCSTRRGGCATRRLC